MVLKTDTKRPKIVTFIGFGVFLFGITNFWRVVSLARQTEIIQPLNPTISPMLRLFLAFAWAGWFIMLAVWIWQRNKQMRWLVPASFGVYALYHILLSIIFVTTPIARDRWLVLLVVYGVISLFCSWGLRRQS